MTLEQQLAEVHEQQAEMKRRWEETGTSYLTDGGQFGCAKELSMKELDLSNKIEIRDANDDELDALIHKFWYHGDTVYEKIAREEKHNRANPPKPLSEMTDRELLHLAYHGDISLMQDIMAECSRRSE